MNGGESLLAASSRLFRRVARVPSYKHRLIAPTRVAAGSAYRQGEDGWKNKHAAFWRLALFLRAAAPALYHYGFLVTVRWRCTALVAHAVP